MASDFEVGRVVAVDTAQVTIELNPDLKALTRATYEGTIEVGQVNSYVIVPVAAHRIVAMLTRVFMVEEAEIHTDKTMVSLPTGRRLMEATMIGTIDGGEFTQGIRVFPVLDSPALVASREDLSIIFGASADPVDPDRPDYCVSIGRAAVFPEYDVRINPDAFFGKHAAIMGSTGAGKSCTVASIIQSILQRSEVRNTRFIILDSNGEYRSAFQRPEGNGDGVTWRDVHCAYRCLYIPTDPNLTRERLTIPYWFMNSEDFLRLFQAAPGVQRPVLLDALRAVRGAGTRAGVGKVQGYPVQGHATEKTAAEAAAALDEGYATADSPRYFGKTTFREGALNEAMGRDKTTATKTKEYCATMVMRISRLLEDKRFEFLFGPVSQDWPEPLNSLATFLRDILGLTPAKQDSLSPISEGIFPFYDRQREPVDEPHNVVVIDLSLLASEVVENVTALIGRLILEFLQRAGETAVSGIERGSFPVVLILEEAQNYIRELRGEEEHSISRQVFERVAREGRKYGLGLLIASQRPSELSRTVLSQCSSFIVHRLQNPEDLRYFREIVPGVYSQLLNQLPALAPRHALVLGECVRAPVLVQVREALPIPASRNPRFYKSWVTADAIVPDVEAVCAKWEGKSRNVEDTVREEG